MGFLIGFSPWIIYWILVGNASFRVAVIVALCLAVLAVLVQRLRRQPWHTLEIGAVVAFAAFSVLAFTVSDSFLERWLQPLGNAAIFLIVLVGMLIRRPFVREYARATVTDDVARSDGFRVITAAMTWMWIAVFAIMTVVSLIPPLVQGDATIHDGASTLSIICYWVIPFTIMGVAGTVSGVFPAWFSSHTDAIDKRQASARPGEPVAQPTAPPDELDPRVVVHAPSTSRHDEPFSIGVDAPGIATLGVTVSGQDLYGRLWRWQGRLAGTGQSVDDILCGMAFTGEPDRADLFVPPVEPWQVRIEVSGEQHRTAVTRLRSSTAPGVHVTEVDVDGRPGLLALPVGGRARQAVVCFGGSEGGYDSQRAAISALASRGLVALAYNWLDADPEAVPVANIPLERFATAISWLAARAEVESNTVVALAISRSSEGVAATLAREPDLPVSALILVSPSSVTWQAIGAGGEIPDTSSWTHRGHPCQYAPLPSGTLMPQLVSNAWHLSRDIARHEPTLLRLAPAYSAGLDALGRSKTATGVIISAENIPCPILCVSGSDDHLWPSEQMADTLLARRQTASDKHIRYDGAGHLLRPGLYPSTVQVVGGIDLGGRPREHGLACLALTDEIVGFVGSAGNVDAVRSAR
ncbi:acyl-CoA thioester hydrolase [Gordonia otitidis]|uniref:acyl-CoA thioester hydrolase/BAAT C-terminal domain-containing protein n=1 Tax=Gordonia otitidis TaxID=249058 RepID=UPI001D13C854|nr:acyl-CoA thioester hydrolase/BAAT C-terminal domain-containing protein [Gordonia otitidis]UEA58858.1 acyl-CoA thioester hydrolase [Gordonia otitidis]